MDKAIYNTHYIYTIDDKEIEISPLKIKYMREFMECFKDIHSAKSKAEAVDTIAKCVQISMKQFCPELSNSVSDVEDNFDLKALYDILEYAGGIKFNRDIDDADSNNPQDAKSTSTWEDFDLVKLETEAFLLGIWKNFDELERSISVAELAAIVSSIRELDYEEKKFLAAMQGVDLEAETNQDRGQKEWEDMKARVFSRGATDDSNDVLALQGQNAKKAGFGIGFGLEYEKIDS
jgi:hypothetical protein